MKKLATCAALAVAGTLGACAEMESESAMMDTGVMAAAQPAGASIKVDHVMIPADGWVVVHAMVDGAPVVPASIGHLQVASGMSGPVEVPLSAPTAAGDQVFVMLHLDTGEAGAYEFGTVDDADPPVLVDGEFVSQVVTVE